MKDLISRQAVLKLLSTMPPEEAITKALLIQSVKQMDAAQPSGPDNLVKDSQGLAKDLVNDCISRKAAIDALRKLREEDIEDYGCEIPEGFNQDHLDRATFAIKQLPPIQPKRGKWIKTARWGRVYYCDQCRNYLDFDGVNAGRGSANFCPNCGAKMRDKDE